MKIFLLFFFLLVIVFHVLQVSVRERDMVRDVLFFFSSIFVIKKSKYSYTQHTKI